MYNSSDKHDCSSEFVYTISDNLYNSSADKHYNSSDNLDLN